MPRYEWEFLYYFDFCKECDRRHDYPVYINVNTNLKEEAMAAEGMAWHEAIRAHSPTDSELISVRVNGPARTGNKELNLE